MRRPPVIPPEANRRGRIRGRRAPSRQGFEEREHAVGPPVADSRQDHIGGLLEGGDSTTADPTGGRRGQIAGIDEIHGDTRARGGLHETSVAGGFRPGAEDENSHPAMVPGSPEDGADPGIIAG